MKVLAKNAAQKLSIVIPETKNAATKNMIVLKNIRKNPKVTMINGMEKRSTNSEKRYPVTPMERDMPNAVQKLLI